VAATYEGYCPSAHHRLTVQGSWWLLCGAFFFYIFAPRFDLGLPIHTGMAALLAMSLIGHPFLRELMSNLRFLRAASFLVALSVYHILLASAYGNDFEYFVSICIACVAYLAFGYLLARYLEVKVATDSEVVYLIVLLFVITTFANAVIVIAEYVFPPFKAAVEALLQQDPGANIPYADHMFRMRGLAAAGGAGLSLAHSVAVWGCVVLWKRGLVGTGLAVLIVCTLEASNIFTGRTGLLIGMVFVLMFFALLMKSVVVSRRISLRAIVGVTIAIAGIAFAARHVTLSDEVISWAFEWALGFLDDAPAEVSTASTDDLKSMLFMPDQLGHLVLGIGFFEGMGALYPRTDSGYLKTLLSVGAPLGILLYTWIGYSLLKLRRFAAGALFFLFPVLAALAVAEIKEPFIYQNALGRFLMTLVGASIALSSRPERLSITGPERGRSHESLGTIAP